MLLVLIALMRNKLLVTCWKTELFITFRLTFVTVQASCIKSDAVHSSKAKCAEHLRNIIKSKEGFFSNYSTVSLLIS